MKKILVIDDNLTIVTLIKLNLEKAGFEVVSLYDGKYALNLIEKEKPDLLLTDVYMPELDGVALVSQIRDIRADLPIIVMSGGGQIDRSEDDLNFSLSITKDLGANETIAKPIDIEQLINMINRLLA